MMSHSFHQDGSEKKKKNSPKVSFQLTVFAQQKPAESLRNGKRQEAFLRRTAVVARDFLT